MKRAIIIPVALFWVALSSFGSVMPKEKAPHKPSETKPKQCCPKPDKPIQTALDSAASEFCVNELLLYAVCFCESSYRPNVDNGIAFGLMQINHTYHEWIGRVVGIDADYKTISGNIRLGAGYLAYLIDSFKSVELALIAYNQGETITRQGIIKCSAKRYAKKILNIVVQWWPPSREARLFCVSAVRLPLVWFIADQAILPKRVWV